MTQWNLYFESENKKIFDVIKALKKNKLLEFIELSDKYGKNRIKINFKDLPPIEKIDHIDLGGHISSFLYKGVKGVKPNRRDVAVYFFIESYVNNGKISNNILNIIKVIGESLKPVKFKLICDEIGPKPVYEGEWDFERFKKNILPEIEFNTKKTVNNQV